MKKGVSILGSTGSIGTQTLEVIRSQQREGDADERKVVALAAGNNIDLLEQQIEEFHPELVCVWDEKKAAKLRERLWLRFSSGKFPGLETFPIPEVMAGMEGLLACATLPSAHIVVTAVVGMIGIRPTIAAIRAGKEIALANKETLVTAGHIIMPLAKEYGVKILPVDSEHSAIFQCLSGQAGNRVKKILLTASGGPFRGKTKQELRFVTREDALQHPNWAMGQKITIDSATMVNKGLEVMEAHWLFDVDWEQIQVVVQPQSVIHSMIEYEDGSVIAQLGTPDMRLPIAYALYYPERRSLPGERLDFWKLPSVTFEKPDLETFTGLALAYEAARIGGSMPVVFNAANERAVAMFLKGEIDFLTITEMIRCIMEGHQVVKNPDVDTILHLEQETYNRIDKMRRTI